MEPLSHTDDEGRAVMVDVSGKPPQRRTAVAEGRIQLSAQTLALVRDNRIAKGDVLTVARLAGIQAAKLTPQLIPLCHPLTLEHIDVAAELSEAGVTVTSRVVCIGRTGVEMEALCAVNAALLTVYDMCKAVDKTMIIGPTRLVQKVKEDAD